MIVSRVSAPSMVHWTGTMKDTSLAPSLSTVANGCCLTDDAEASACYGDRANGAAPPVCRPAFARTSEDLWYLLIVQMLRVGGENFCSRSAPTPRRADLHHHNGRYSIDPKLRVVRWEVEVPRAIA